MTKLEEKIPLLTMHMNYNVTLYLFTMVVKRLVKHTGYGNAAGLLARRGLMAGGSGSRGIQYSDDDDSDTEEYRQNAHM